MYPLYSYKVRRLLLRGTQGQAKLVIWNEAGIRNSCFTQGVNIIGRDGLMKLNIFVDPTQFSTTAVVHNPEDRLQEVLQIHADIFDEGLGCCITTEATLAL